MAKELTLTFEWDGKTVNKETSGFEGKSCTAETAFIEEALNGRNKKLKKKSEYYRAEVKERTDRLRDRS